MIKIIHTSSLDDEEREDDDRDDFDVMLDEMTGDDIII